MNDSFVAGPPEFRAFVDFIAPAGARRRGLPVLMIHGGAHTGDCYRATPDGRTGWAPYFAGHGFPVYVLDWPGHGRSPESGDLHRMSTRHVADAIVDAVERIGPLILMTHSMSGQIGWSVTERVAANVAAIVALAPGPPGNIMPVLGDDAAVHRHAEDAPIAPTREDALVYWANADRFPSESLDAYLATLVAESGLAMNERANFGGRALAVADAALVAARPILVVTGDQDTRHPYEIDAAVVSYFNADWIWLADAGKPGHGHMLMIEDGHLGIADLVLNWLRAKGLDSFSERRRPSDPGVR